MSYVTYAGNVFVHRDFDLRPFEPKIYWVSTTDGGHFYVMFGNPNSCFGFGDIVSKTDKQTST